MLKKITTKNFRPFGRVIEYPAKGLKNKKTNLFCIVLTESQPRGWRIAYLVVRDKAIDKLERHPDTYESFEPVSGKTILYLARPGIPSKVESFILDKPVILNKGVWHGVVTLSNESEIKITENARVKSDFRNLPSR
ncbi:MAG: hypothetical protein MUC39_01215 [Candidatus Omnitrophica bacterium]|jgi:ureidoglycolate hydrolase|nr:hypothetical protein [Candidatus Omnitrophota bacterium]